MPFTPLHAGPGLAVKAALPRHFSLTTFGLAQIAIDIEVLVYILQGKPYLHRFWHTFLGATLIAFLMPLPGKPASQWIKKQWNRATGIPAVPVRTTWTASFAGAAIGAYTHILLDSLFHNDVEPLQPWSSANPLYGLVNPSDVETICVILGIAGLAGLIIRRALRTKTGWGK
ncbi:MAG TPA: hypothetical protein PKN80_00195 [bacterium]|nr:hypothetical protein [bacterium]